MPDRPTARHNRVAGNIFRILSDCLNGSACQVFINDMKLHVQAADSVQYPTVAKNSWPTRNSPARPPGS